MKDFNTMVEEIHEETGFVGRELENVVFGMGYVMALLAGNDEAADYFNSRFEENQKGAEA